MYFGYFAHTSSFDNLILGRFGLVLMRTRGRGFDPRIHTILNFLSQRWSEKALTETLAVDFQCVEGERFLCAPLLFTEYVLIVEREM